MVLSRYPAKSMHLPGRDANQRPGNGTADQCCGNVIPIEDPVRHPYLGDLIEDEAGDDRGDHSGDVLTAFGEPDEREGKTEDQDRQEVRERSGDDGAATQVAIQPATEKELFVQREGQAKDENDCVEEPKPAVGSRD